MLSDLHGANKANWLKTCTKKEKTLNTKAPHLKKTLCVAGKKERIEIFLLYCKRKESVPERWW